MTVVVDASVLASDSGGAVPGPGDSVELCTGAPVLWGLELPGAYGLSHEGDPVLMISEPVGDTADVTVFQRRLPGPPSDRRVDGPHGGPPVPGRDQHARHRGEGPDSQRLHARGAGSLCGSCSWWDCRPPSMRRRSSRLYATQPYIEAAVVMILTLAGLPITGGSVDDLAGVQCHGPRAGHQSVRRPDASGRCIAVLLCRVRVGMGSHGSGTGLSGRRSPVGDIFPVALGAQAFRGDVRGLDTRDVGSRPDSRLYRGSSCGRPSTSSSSRVAGRGWACARLSAFCAI